MRAAYVLILMVIFAAFGSDSCRRDKRVDTQQRTQGTNSANAGDPFAAIPRITVEELVAAIKEDRVVIVDIETADAYREEHIKGAVSIPLDEVRERGPKELPTTKLIVTYCACPAEHSSAQAASFLRYKGFKQTAALLGGLDAWKAAGLPVERS